MATSSDTVNPMPAIVPPPATASQPTGGRRRPRLSRVTSQDTPTMPTGLPTRYPSAMPSVTGEVYAAARKPGLITMPALHSANSGTIR